MQTKPMKWQPVSVLPKFEPMRPGYTFEESQPLLVWIESDPMFTGFASGRCIKYEDGQVTFKADAFSGNWNITHWAYVEPPKE